MSNSRTFSLAVISGTARGERLKTNRGRITVGRAPTNDLVVQDSDIANRHFVVQVEDDRWRIRSLSDEHPITVDRRWVHPSSGRRGAIVHANGIQVLVYPAELEDAIINTEVKKRAKSAGPAPNEDDSLVTRVQTVGVEFEDAEIANEPTMAVDAASLVPQRGMDLVEMSQMPTIAGERPPDDLREAARVRLIGARQPSEAIRDPALQNQPVVEATASMRKDPYEDRTMGVSWSEGKADATPIAKKHSGSAWDRAKRPSRTPVPDVVAEPESGQMTLPGSGKSTMSRRPDLGSADPNVVEVDPVPARSGSNKKRRNAWGDRIASDAGRDERMPEEKRPSGEPSPAKNAWGEPRSKPPTAWDGAPRPQNSRALKKRDSGHGIQLEVESLALRSADPGLEILRRPDGELATSIRLMGTRIDEFSRNLGYRTFMVTSAEPLTGKTTGVMNLALALAEDTNRRIALIEANFRYPRLHQILGVESSKGILGALEGRSALSDSVIKIKNRNLVVLPTGGRHRHPAEVLASPRFKTLIAELADTVDLAIVDAPSVAPFADANLILPLVDAVFFVVSGNDTRTGQIARAITQLGEQRVLGAMYNNIPKGQLKSIRKERRNRMRHS